MQKIIHPDSAEAFMLLQKTMMAGNYSPRSIATYLREVHYSCMYYPELPPHQWTDANIIDYMTYLKNVHQASYSKSMFCISTDLPSYFSKHWISIFRLPALLFSD